MEKLGLNEIRKRFKDFYVDKGHYAASSASLIPKNDKSLMIINSGMAPLKPYFAGVETPPDSRMTTCQKCVRTGDIENVGITARHGTFFEMLGNFSFGDYFKKESLTWGWEFITEVLKMPTEKIWATIYEDDDEAHDIWIELGMPEERIVRLGKDDNFWEIGLGPCGPCSEIFFDKGEDFGCGSPDCRPGCECDRYIEFWNHVFTQFSKEEDGTYSDLSNPNIDTGMGLERIACIMQGVDSIFDIDTIRHILNAVVDLSDVKYEDGNNNADISIRIITDHLRSMVFMIADGILPSNEGRGYILRRLIRRASRHGKLLGINDEFLSGLVDKVIEVSGEAYPEIVEKRDYIKKIVSLEESKFSQTLQQGLNILNLYIDNLTDNNETKLKGELAFKLYDTYGFPIELTQEILEEKNKTLDINEFRTLMEQQKQLARKGRKSTEGDAWKDASDYDNLNPTEFIGYTKTESLSKILYIGEYDKKHKLIIFDKTPFYATSGGQICDTGIIKAGGTKIKVDEVIKENGIFVHIINEYDFPKLKKFRVSDEAELVIDKPRRNRISRGHSATHLLQKALKDVLGDHVMQAGSYVDDKYLRFDFNHFQGITSEELSKVEEIVNSKIDDFMDITMKEMPIEEAKKLGATALFGEKYGDRVRVVTMGDYSLEFCGGTHINNTGKIGAFKILSESGIASGVKRIEAVTGTSVVDFADNKAKIVRETSEILKSSEADLTTKVKQLVEDKKELEKSINKIKSEEMSGSLNDIINNAKEIKGIKLITNKFENTDINQLRELSDEIKSQVRKAIMVFATVNEGKVLFIVAVTDDLVTEGYHAGKIIKTVAKAAGGGGGGKANMAQAGAKDPDKINEAFLKAEELI